MTADENTKIATASRAPAPDKMFLIAVRATLSPMSLL